MLRGPGRWQYARTAVKKRVTKIIYEVYRALGRTVPQHIGTMHDINAFAAAHYTPQLYPGHLTLLRTRPDSQVSIKDYQLGWGGLASGGVEVHEVPGDHDDMTSGPNAQALAQKLEFCMVGQLPSRSELPAALGSVQHFGLQAGQTDNLGKSGGPMRRLAQSHR